MKFVIYVQYKFTKSMKYFMDVQIFSILSDMFHLSQIGYIY